MENKKILDQAIDLLKNLDLANAESVQINNTKFDDGSSCIEVGVSYPATKELAETPAEKSSCVYSAVTKIVNDNN